MILEFQLSAKFYFFFCTNVHQRGAEYPQKIHPNGQKKLTLDMWKGSTPKQDKTVKKTFSVKLLFSRAHWISEPSRGGAQGGCAASLLFSDVDNEPS